MSEIIEDLIHTNDKSINYQDLYSFFDQKLKELYDEEKTIPLLDYSDIRNSAVIDFIYKIMPSLRDEIKLNESSKQIQKIVR